MKNKIIFIVIILLVFMILLIPLKGSYAFYSDNKDLNIINTKIGDFRDNIIKLRENDKNNNLSEGTPGGMYRYQGTDNISNWICFGTTENCGINDDLIDKYMYRIIGITKEGQLYLLKETFIKEGVNGFAWNDTGAFGTEVNTCPDNICPEWNESLLFKRINGTSNGTTQGSGSYSNNADTDIFVDSEYYDYLKSGDGVNGTKDEKGSTWYQLISDHDWMYGETSSSSYNGDTLYAIETGQAETTHRVQNPKGSTTVESQSYEWPDTNKVSAKISIMYLHDVAYSYANCSNGECISRGNPGNGTNIKNSWIHFLKDGYNTTPTSEWLSPRIGVSNVSSVIDARLVMYSGTLHGSYALYGEYGVRPVFYLNANAMISHGKGTKENPFILHVN